ncbi:MAG TPA: trehalose-phosphatase [Anaeromyxobacteraceae bacterium]|nr:trehalose-phosphatase [Anaeromyxobacteraceae bacterium]
MRDLLALRQREVLERLARARALLAFDYDGVLAPLVADPAGAALPGGTRRLLARLARAWPCAIVSGRSYDYLRRATAGVVPHLVGNHGFELLGPRPLPRSLRARARSWRASMERDLEGVPGVYLEEKGATFAVHYGLGPRREEAERAVLASARRLEGVRLVPGKRVVNVLPGEFPDKGDAVRALLARLGLDTALFLGDDVTDESAFALGPPLVIGVRVGAGPTRAAYRLAGIEAVRELLRRLGALRPAGRGPAVASRAR